jgi:hypothetical protein
VRADVDGLRDGRSHEVVEDARSRGDARALRHIEAERWLVADDRAALKGCVKVCLAATIAPLPVPESGNNLALVVFDGLVAALIRPRQASQSAPRTSLPDSRGAFWWGSQSLLPPFCELTCSCSRSNLRRRRAAPSRPRGFAPRLRGHRRGAFISADLWLLQAGCALQVRVCPAHTIVWLGGVSSPKCMLARL